MKGPLGWPNLLLGEGAIVSNSPLFREYFIGLNDPLGGGGGGG